MKSVAGLGVARAHVETLGEGEAGLVGVGGDVSGVDEENVGGLGTDAGDVAPGEFGLDDVAHDAVPAGEHEVPLEGWRTDVE